MEKPLKILAVTTEEKKERKYTGRQNTRTCHPRMDTVAAKRREKIRGR